ncbi:MAG: N-acetylneuraminate synthase family protein, partial [Janthinobacterium lividum]
SVIARDKPAFLIAEIGNNRDGSVELARRLVHEAVAAGAECVKFQLRSMRQVYRNAGDASDAGEDPGARYTLDLLSRFQLAVDDMFVVFDYRKSRGILPLCTPWDEESPDALELEALARTGKPLICSTGMSMRRRRPREPVGSDGLLA